MLIIIPILSAIWPFGSPRYPESAVKNVMENVTRTVKKMLWRRAAGVA